MRTSEQIDKIAAALSKAQGEIEPAKKDSVNPFFKSNYADLSSVIAVLKKPLATNGLSFVQGLSSENQESFMTTTLMHSSGQYIVLGPVRIPVKEKDNPQNFKSSITYMRRTMLLSAFGIEESDDDGNMGASIKQAQPMQQKPAPLKNYAPTGLNK